MRPAKCRHEAAAAVGLTAAEAQAGVMRANAAKWPPTTSRYWWTQATAAYTRDVSDDDERDGAPTATT